MCVHSGDLGIVEDCLARRCTGDRRSVAAANFEPNVGALTIVEKVAQIFAVPKFGFIT